METYQILEDALNEIRDERDWCQGQMFRYSPDLNRSQRCALGAICDVVPLGLTWEDWPVEYRDAYQALDAVAHRRAGQGMPVYNDTHSHSEVVAVFQEAIRLEKARLAVAIPAADDFVVPVPA